MSRWVLALPTESWGVFLFMDLNQIILGDCMELLPLLDDGIADLIILDPNYNDWDSLCKEGLISEAVRLLKPTGNLLCFTKQPFDYNLRLEIDHIFRREIIWTFTNGGAWVSNRMPLVSFQKIYWSTISNDFYFNQRTGLPYNDKTTNFKRSKKVWEGYNCEGRDFLKSEDGVWIRDHLHFNKPNMGGIPAKPLELIDILIRCFSPTGGLVIDPFCGSGQIPISCLKQNRNFISYELSDKTYNIANNRLNSQQLKLF